MIKNILLIIVAVVVIVLVFRNIDITKEVAVEITNPTSESETFNPSVADSNSVRLNSDQSVIEWTGKNILQSKSHTGTLSLKDDVSYLTLVPSNEAGDMRVSSGAITVDMTTLDAANEPDQLIAHLKSEDFFFVEQYPTAQLVVTGSNEGSIEGLLDMHGISKSVTIPYELQKDGERYIIQGSFSIDRTEWEVTTMSKNFFDNLGDSVIEDTIELRFVLVTN